MRPAKVPVRLQDQVLLLFAICALARLRLARVRFGDA